MRPLREHNQAPFFIAETKPPYPSPRMGGAQYAGAFGHHRRIMPLLVCPKHVALTIERGAGGRCPKTIEWVRRLFVGK